MRAHFCHLIISAISSVIYLARAVLFKFGFSEKATIFEKIFVILLTRASCSVRATARTCQKVDEDFSKQMWSSRITQTLTSKRFFHIFVAFPEYLNLKIKVKNKTEECNLIILSNRETCPVPLANALE